MRSTIAALRTNRVIDQTPGLQYVRVYIQSLELRARTGLDAVIPGAGGGVVGLVGYVCDVAEEGHRFDCEWGEKRKEERS